MLANVLRERVGRPGGEQHFALLADSIGALDAAGQQRPC